MTRDDMPSRRYFLDECAPARHRPRMLKLQSLTANAVLSGAMSAPLQRLTDRAEAASRKIDFYQNGPLHQQPLWVEAPATTREERTKIAECGVAIQEVGAGQVAGTASRADIFALRDKSLPHIIKDPGEVFNVFPPSDAVYHDYDEMVAELKAIAALRPDFVKMFSLGKTLEGRDIWALQLNHGFDEKKPGAVFIGTHHAREHLSTEVPLLLARHLVENADKPEIKALLANRDVTIIPMLNSDGVTYDIRSGRRYEMWRKNRRKNADGSYGVDLNRNYAAGWDDRGASKNPSSETYRGTSPFSEPETQAVKAFLEGKSNVKILLTYHTFSELILYPRARSYDPVANETDRKTFETIAQQMAKWTGYTPQQSSALYLAYGEMCDYLYEALGLFAFTFELTPKSQSQGGFYPGPHVIQPTFERTLSSALHMIGLADNPRRVLGI